ncbi:sulfite exporter TauE/SafE family protein [Candidatus Pelagibacter giovannonii]|uniref:Probable membrane transporter protein n=1 Tax=Candidatus Pelagibacter giovannonii TaxID=2563896 RepID=A0A6H1Q3R0_9PROT|nr:sulfite exporter TauE/SafE family protein [Candidatus Pelagibacter giovannonii]QIZ21431.1 sulfite exporter TauE/SafE family protein [Candidatus Pelagibacter giovannonii]
MDFLSYFQLSLIEIYYVIFIVFIASIIRGFNGFGFSAICISGFSFILPAIEIVPIILALEVVISIFMVPYIWNKIDWRFVFKILLGIIIGSPIGLYLLKYLNPQTTHLSVCLLVIFFSILLMKGFSNQKINNNYGKFFTGIISGALNGLTTLGGMPVALFLLITSIQPAVIRGSLAALFFLTDIYAFVLSFFSGIVDMTTIYRVILLIIILPLGVFIGDKFFVKSKEETYRKVVFYFLIIISIIGVLRIISNF